MLTQEYPAIEEDLEQVVGEHGVLEAVGLPVPHERGPEHPDHQEVGQADDEGGGGAGHEQPVPDPGVSPVLHDEAVLPQPPGHQAVIRGRLHGHLHLQDSEPTDDNHCLSHREY